MIAAAAAAAAAADALRHEAEAPLGMHERLHSRPI